MREREQQCEGADGWRTKDLKRLGLHLKACPFIDFPPDLLLHTHIIISHSFILAVPMATYSVLLQEGPKPVTAYLCL